MITKLTPEESLEKFEEIYAIINESFEGVELPSRSEVLDKIKAGTVFADCISGRPLGITIILHQVPMRLWCIAVDPNCRGIGIGTDLLREISNYYRGSGVQAIDLNVNANNPAQKLYFDEGYRVVAVLENYYGPESGLRMKKVL